MKRSFKLLTAIFLSLAPSSFAGDPHSAFHYLNFNEVLKNQWNGQIPFPPSKAIDDLLSIEPNVRITSVVMPHGRSLERFATVDENQPRTLFSWRHSAAGTVSDESFDSNTFFAYTPGKQEMEIITYNNDTQQFDFKLLLNYGPNLKSQLVPADRAVCTACHQFGQPIFPVFPWSETAQTTTVSQQPLIRSILENPTLEPFAKRIMHNQDKRIEVDPPQMDSLVRGAVAPYYAMKTCGVACKGNAECTRLSIKAAIFDRFGLCRTDRCEEFLQPLLDSMTDTAPGKFFDNDSLPEREPGIDKVRFTATEDPLSPRVRDDMLTEISGSLAFVYAPICYPFTIEEKQQLQISERDTLKFLNSPQMTALIQSSINGIPAKDDLLAVLTGHPPILHAIIEAKTPAAPMLSRGNCANVGRNFLRYCATCHEGEDSIAPTLPLENLKTLREYIGQSNPLRTVQHLMSGPEPLMPPKEAFQPSQEERQQMLDVIAGKGSCKF